MSENKPKTVEEHKLKLNWDLFSKQTSGGCCRSTFMIYVNVLQTVNVYEETSNTIKL